jgi:hypothetical protein
MKQNKKPSVMAHVQGASCAECMTRSIPSIAIIIANFFNPNMPLAITSLRTGYGT